MSSMYKYLKVITVLSLTAMIGCSKLNQPLNNALTTAQAKDAFSAANFLAGAYNDVGNPWSDMGNICALEEVTSDECVVPTRAKDWDDNGAWRALHFHTYGTVGVGEIEGMFNALNKINFDATNVLSFSYTPSQGAQARFLRALALYQILDLYGQFPFRNPGDNLLNAPPVLTGDSAVQFIVSELNAILPDLPTTGSSAVATQNAARVLLMRTLLNRGAFINRAAPTFDDADMQKVILIGDTIINSGTYSYETNYFKNFDNNNSSSTEAIFACPNVSGVATNNTNIANRWYAPSHYNMYTPLNPAAGWNGFSTFANTYNSFAVNGATTTQTPADTVLDQRLGGRFYPGCTDQSGLRPGFLIGQQYNENKQKIMDRNGNFLTFLPDFTPDMHINGPLLELNGYRILKYPPDFSQGVKSYQNGGNWIMIFRYSEVVLMVAEALKRQASPDDVAALNLVNDLRSHRGAVALTNMDLVSPATSNKSDTAAVYAPNTLLAERGRELYWENVRRTDLIRFGVFLNAWAYHQPSTPQYLLFPVPPASLAANPNLKQNPGF